MLQSTLVFLKIRRKSAKALLGDHALVSRRADLLLLIWHMDFSDLTGEEAAAEMLWTSLGAELLRQHDDPRGILVIPLAPVLARNYAGAVAAHSDDGRWIANIAREPGGHLVAAEQAEIPLPRFPNARLIEFYLVKPARAMRELELSTKPLRTLRFEQAAVTTPRAVSAFYLPLLKEHGLKVKRRVWSSGTAERLSGSSDSIEVVVHAASGPTETFIRLSWAIKG